MQTIIDDITVLFTQHNDATISSIEKLPQSGSERQYFRIYTASKNYIATFGANIPENKVFIYFSDHFKQKNLATPEIYYCNEDSTIYVQEDFGNVSLLDRLENNGYTDEVYALYKKSLHELARLQVEGDQSLDYSRCLTNSSFGKQAIMADLLYLNIISSMPYEAL
jgi:UPF0042 nucleotide-binding protein